MGTAFTLSGLVCISGLSRLTDGSWWLDGTVSLILAGYVVVASAVLAIRHADLVRTLWRLWLAAAALVLLAVAAEVPSLGVLAAVSVYVLLYATVLFGFWTTFALVGLTLARRNFWHEPY